MSVISMLFKEAWQRKGASLLSLITVAVAAGLFITLITFNRALQRETVQQMKALGFNLVILPANTSPENYWSGEYGDFDMPEDYVDRLAGAKKITANHFSGKLEQQITWEGRTAILTGLLGTRARGRKTPLGIKVPPSPGTAYCGFEIARAVQVEKDEAGKVLFNEAGSPKLRPIHVMGQTFAVAKRLARQDIKNDMRIILNLRDAQRLLGKPGRIHAIEAMGCRCEGDVVAKIQSEVEDLLNKGAADTDKVKALIPDEPKFYTREKMRKKVEGYAALAAPAVLFVCILWIGALSYMNVRQRREEIGLLRAVGVGSGPIAALFLGKAALMGFVGAGLGFALGSVVAGHYGPAIFEITGHAIKPIWTLLVGSLILSPTMAMLAAAIPTMLAVAMDPAEALREE